MYGEPKVMKTSKARCNVRNVSDIVVSDNVNDNV